MRQAGTKNLKNNYIDFKYKGNLIAANISTVNLSNFEKIIISCA